MSVATEGGSVEQDCTEESNQEYGEIQDMEQAVEGECRLIMKTEFIAGVNDLMLSLFDLYNVHIYSRCPGTSDFIDFATDF